MGMPVRTVAAGGLPVIDVSATIKTGLPVTEAANGFGVPVTKVTAFGLPVVYVTAPLLEKSNGQADRSWPRKVAGRETAA
jgi:hypothetical protein